MRLILFLSLLLSCNTQKEVKNDIKLGGFKLEMKRCELLQNLDNITKIDKTLLKDYIEQENYLIVEVFSYPPSDYPNEWIRIKSKNGYINNISKIIVSKDVLYFKGELQELKKKYGEATKIEGLNDQKKIVKKSEKNCPPPCLITWSGNFTDSLVTFQKEFNESNYVFSTHYISTKIYQDSSNLDNCAPTKKSYL